MSNEIPRSYIPIVQHLEDAADGAHVHGAAVGLQQNIESAIRTDLYALIGTPEGPGGVPPAVPGLKALWNVAKANKTAMTGALRSVLSTSRTLAMTCIASLKPVLGNQWNSTWNAAGFTDGSIAVPVNPMVMLQQLRAYFAANPARETANVQGIACTAAACEAAVQAISDAQSASNQSNTDAGAAKAALEAGIAAGRTRLAGLRDELAQLISDDDNRWYSFGFVKPGDQEGPEVPENLVVTQGIAGSHSLIIDWDDAVRADNYRVIAKDNATQQEFANFIVQDSDATITLPAIPAGTMIAVTVSARNETGESQTVGPVIVALP